MYNTSIMNTNTEHPLIPRQQTYMLDHKIVSVCSEDRDVCQWTNRAHFEITLPQQLLNVETIRLVECNFPSINFTFKNSYYNTKLVFTVNGGAQIILTIDEGFYTPKHIANELTNKLNYYTAIYLAIPSYLQFVVVYNEVTQKLQFGNKLHSFELCFDEIITYDVECHKNTISECQFSKWGLPYYLGFERVKYSSSFIVSTTAIPLSNASFKNLTYMKITDATYYWLSIGSGYFYNAPNLINVVGETNFYMELDKCNQADEINPYSMNANSTYNNKYNGVINSFFAKIPILGCPNTQYFDSRNGLIQNLTTFFPPLERMGKIKVKFRYHDGTLVNFSADFSFSLAFDCYRDEMARTLTLRTPAQYRL